MHCTCALSPCTITVITAYEGSTVHSRYGSHSTCLPWPWRRPCICADACRQPCDVHPGLFILCLDDLDVTLVTLCRALVTRVTAMTARRLLSTCAPIGSPSNSSQTRVQVANLCIKGMFLFGAGGIYGFALSRFSNLSERVHELDRSTQAHMGKVEVHLGHLEQRGWAKWTSVLNSWNKM